MEYVDGTDLARLVHKHGPLPVPQACEYVRQAALGLQHAHERGLVHRDIKPSNLLVSQTDGQPPVVKVLDLGLARLGSESFAQERGLTRMGQMLGTPDYLAPEQAIDARKVDTRADIYSLGCSLFYLLVGRAPFQAEALAELLMKHQMEAPPLVRLLRPDVPEALDALLQRMMAKKPERRPSTPAEVAAALEPFARGEQVGAAYAIAPAPVGRIPPTAMSGDDFATMTADEGVAGRPERRDRTRDTVAEPPPKARKRKGEPEEKKDSRLPVIIGAAVGGGSVLLAGIGVLLYLLLSGGKPDEQTAQPGGQPKVQPKVQPKGTGQPTPPKEMPPAVPPEVKPPADDGTLFGAIEAAIKAGTTARSRMAGGLFPSTDFEDVPVEGALLTGLEIGLGKFNTQDVIHSLRPIYQTRKGRLLGSLQGEAPRVVTVEAKPGYAVGCLTVKAGAGLDGIVVTFMAIEGKGLSTTRFYQSEWIGGVGGVQPVYMVGDGTPIIGIFGKVARATTGLGAISLTAPKGPPAIPPVTVPAPPQVTPVPPVLATRVPGEVKGFNLVRGTAVQLRFAGAGRAFFLDLNQIRLIDLERVRTIKTYPAGGKLLRCLAVSADGKTLATGASDGTVLLWDVNSGSLKHTLQHESSVAAVAFSPDGNLLAAAHGGVQLKDGQEVRDGTGKRMMTYGVQAWNVETGSRELRYSALSVPRSVAFSADGKYLLTSTFQQPLRAWNVETKGALRGTDNVPLKGASYIAPVEKGLILLGLGGEIVLWDLPGARLVRSFRGHTAAIHGLVVVPGGKQFVSIAGQRAFGTRQASDTTLRLWDVDKGREVGWTSFPEIPLALDVSPDGAQALVAARTGSAVRLIDLGKLTPAGAAVAKSTAPLKPEDRFKGHVGEVTSVAYSSDGKYILTGGKDGTARLWDAATGAEIHQVSAGSEVAHVCFAGDGQTFAVFTAGRAQGYSTDKGTLSWSYSSTGSNSGCLSSDGGEVVLTGSTFLRTYSPQKRSSFTAGKKGKTTCAAYSPDSSFYAYGDALGFVHVHRIDVKKDVGTYLTHKAAAVTCLAVCAGAVPRIVSGGADNVIWVRSGVKLQSVKRLTGHTGPVTDVSLTGDGKLLASSSEDRTVRVWDAAPARLLRTFTDENEVLGVAISPDGKMVVSCGSKGLRFWDLTAPAKP
jgi:WD40 repeat protein